MPPSEPALPREEEQKEKVVTKTQVKPNSGALEGENLGAVADWGTKGKAAWQNAVAGRKHWSKSLLDQR